MEENAESKPRDSTKINAETCADQACTTTKQMSSQLSKSGKALNPIEKGRVSRLKFFNKVMERSLKKFIDDASFQKFAKTFHPFYKKDPQVMESVHKRLIEDLQKAIQEDIGRMVEEGELQCKLDELDKMEKAANDKEPTWRPCGVPEEDLCSFVVPYYKKQEVYLRKQLKTIQAENAALALRVQSGRDAIAHTEKRIATAVDEWKESVRESQMLASSLCPVDTFDV